MICECSWHDMWMFVVSVLHDMWMFVVRLHDMWMFVVSVLHDMNEIATTWYVNVRG